MYVPSPTPSFAGHGTGNEASTQAVVNYLMHTVWAPVSHDPPCLGSDSWAGMPTVPRGRELDNQYHLVN